MDIDKQKLRDILTEHNVTHINMEVEWVTSSIDTSWKMLSVEVNETNLIEIDAYLKWRDLFETYRASSYTIIALYELPSLKKMWISS